MPRVSRHVAVIGGGPAGLATTLQLLSFGFQVTLFERSQYRDVVVGEHLRPDALQLLARLGVDRAVWESNSLRCSEIHSAWGRNDIGVAEYFFNPYGDSLVLARPAFDARLAEEARKRGARLVTGARVSKVQWRDDDGWRVSTGGEGSQETTRADFLVDASGRSGFVRRALRIGQVVEDRMVGIVGFVGIAETGASPLNTLLIEGTEDGWWYSARLPADRIVATYMTDADILTRFPNGPLGFWQDRLERTTHTRARLMGHETPAAVHVRSAATRKLARTVGESWLAVGDAAMSFDPLSSQGISKGFYWGIRAAKAIAAANEGSDHELGQYEEDMQESFGVYLDARRAYYRAEQRWPDSSFWHNRACA